MSLSTCAVTCIMYDQQGQPLPGARFRFKLSHSDVNAGYVVPEAIEVSSGNDGIAVVDLWPNAAGNSASYYEVTITNPDTGRKERLTAYIPDIPAANLHDVGSLPDYPGKPDGAIAVEAAVTAGQTALGAANAASTSRDEALAAADVAVTNRDEAVAAKDIAISSASSATASAATASSAASTATTQASTATTKASEASESAAEAGISEANSAASASTANNAASTATSAANTATQKATEASASAAIATTQAGIATTGANTATQKAAEASASEISAAAAAAAAAASVLPTGSIITMPGDADVPGFMRVYGFTLNRADEPDLWAYAQASGNLVAEGLKEAGQFGDGDGSTTFSIPDYRGYHPRFFSAGSVIDAGRVLGSEQLDAIKYGFTDVRKAASGLLALNGSGGSISLGNGASGYSAAFSVETYAHTLQRLSVGDLGVNETRPINVALVPYIKY